MEAKQVDSETLLRAYFAELEWWELEEVAQACLDAIRVRFVSPQA